MKRMLLFLLSVFPFAAYAEELQVLKICWESSQKPPFLSFKGEENKEYAPSGLAVDLVTTVFKNSQNIKSA